MEDLKGEPGNRQPQPVVAPLTRAAIFLVVTVNPGDSDRHCEPGDIDEKPSSFCCSGHEFRCRRSLGAQSISNRYCDAFQHADNDCRGQDVQRVRWRKR